MNNKISNGFQIIHDLIKLKWVPEILESISLNNLRYNEILRSIQYLSHTELNRKLTMLADKGVINKAINEQNVSYSLTLFGEELVHIFQHLKELEERYFDERAL